MRKQRLHAVVFAVVAIGAVPAAGSPGWAQSRSFNVARQPAASGIAELASQADIQVLVSDEAVRGKVTQEVRGESKVDEAFRNLLKGTRLRVASNDGRTITLAAAPGPSESEPAGAADGQLEEVVVTAQRRAETAQTVPISIATLTAKQIENSGIQTTQDLVIATPGLTMTQTRGGLVPYLRGVGSQQSTTEGAVALYVDNIYYASTQGAFFTLNNVERVEVLKGPQGTLFGRNVTGGLIHVITKDPSYTPELRGSIGYGNFETVSGNLYATAPLGNKAAMDFSFTGSHQGEGWGRNLFLGDDVNIRNEWAARSKLRIDAFENTKVIASIDYSRWRSDIGSSRQTAPGTKAVGGVLPVGSIYDINSDVTGTYKNSSQFGGDPRNWQWGANLKIEHSFSDSLSLTSISGWREVDVRSYFDVDTVPVAAPRVEVYFRENVRTFQQDLLLNGTTSHLKWTTGLNYYHYVMLHAPYIRASAPPANTFSDSVNTNDSYAAFGQGTYDFGQGTSLTLGVRYTVDKLHNDATVTGTPGYPPGLGGPGAFITSTSLSPKSRTHQKWDSLTWRGALDHKISDDILVYVSYSKGFKAGAFNPASPPIPSNASPIGDVVRPETLYAYEVGLKSEWLQRQLRVNAALFYNDYRNLQLLQIAPTGLTAALFNAASASIYGGELEVTYAPPIRRGNLQITGSVTLLDPTYGTFRNAPVNIPLPGGGNAAVNCQTNPAGCDVTGNQTIRASKISSSVGLNYSIPVSDEFEMALDVNWQHTGKFYFEVDNRMVQPAYDIVNTQIAFGRRDNAWRVRAWARNLGDTGYFVFMQSSNFSDAAAPGAPRTYGVNLDFKFGG